MLFVTSLYSRQEQDWSRDEFLTHLRDAQQPFTVYEYLKDDVWVKPYFDYETYMEAQVDDEHHRTLVMEAIATLFEDDPEFSKEQVALAQRHRWVKKGKGDDARQYKISLRAYVQGYKIKFTEIKSLINELTVGTPAFDTSVYNNGRLLGVIGGCKTTADTTPLTAITHIDQPEAFLAQHLTGDEVILSAPDNGDSNWQNDSSDSPIWQVVVPLLKEAGFVAPVMTGQREHSLHFTAENRGGACPCCHLIHTSQNWYIMPCTNGRYKVRSYSMQCKTILVGGMDVIVCNDPSRRGCLTQVLCDLGLTQLLEDGHTPTGDPCYIVRQHLANCPACRSQHMDPTYYVESIVTDCFAMRNADRACKQRLIGMAAGRLGMNKHLHAIYETPKREKPLVEFYITERGCNLASDNKDFYVFDGKRWKQEQEFLIHADIQNWLDEVLTKLRLLLHHEEEMLLGDKTAIKCCRQVKDRIEEARSYIRSETTSRHLVESLKRRVATSTFHEDMDANPYLLGVNNGVIDLKTGIFRAATREDMVSLSVGYDYKETSTDTTTEAEVATFLTQVYPDKDERELVQRYMGYCLLGSHTEKVFLLLTDERGGYNGKSTILSLLNASLGAYARKVDACVLYKQDRVRSINDHQAGLLSLEKVRCMYVEETDPSKVLDDSLLKDMNGGGTTFSGRDMYSSGVREFSWRTKLIMAFNEGKMPHFTVEDSALVDRMLTVPHRSRFYLEDVPENIAHSFVADTNIKSKFDAWRPHFLRWCLEGLMAYHCKGFRDVPDACKAFKQQLVSEKDTIADFINSNVCKGEKGDFLKLTELYNMYNTEQSALQRDKKTSKDAATFRAAVCKCLGNAQLKSHHSYRDGGVNKTVRNVVMGYTLTSQHT